ncbi:MAG TPA: c-type cytochrome [Steroidobacteraceae bacterium]|nr:c-type cytochrome [Steroidobacteraceae bacterium]
MSGLVPVLMAAARSRRVRVSIAVLALALGCGARVCARENPTAANPVTGEAQAIKEGAALFRANCSPCHGPNAAGGGRGPNLSANHWTHGSSDADIFRTITRGVPGTDMPANDLEDLEVWNIVAYLRSLAPVHAAMSGDANRGERLFFQTQGCSVCHMVNGRGGVLGPELSRVGASRSSAYLVDSIREPDKVLSAAQLDPNDHYGLPLVYDTVTVTTAGGERIVGIAKNEDTFSIQLLDTQQNLRLFRKSELVQVSHEQKSLMPRYTEAMLSAPRLQDLLAYLTSLR